MKLKLFVPILLLVIISFSSCSPSSKESYLKRYEAFIEKVSEKGDNYTDEDWKDMDEDYKQLNEEWYNKFKDELSLTEKLTVKKYSVQYTFYRNKP
jgi:hypothetical protein